MPRGEMRPDWTGPILIAVDQDAADQLGIPLAELRRAASWAGIVATRSYDGAPLRRTVEVLDALDPVRALAARLALVGSTAARTRILDAAGPELADPFRRVRNASKALTINDGRPVPPNGWHGER